MILDNVWMANLAHYLRLIEAVGPSGAVIADLYLFDDIRCVVSAGPASEYLAKGALPDF